MFAWAFNSSILAAADSAGPFTIHELQQLLVSEFGSNAAEKMMWALSPFEYLARHGHKGDRLFVGSMPVSALLPYIPVVMDHCRELIGVQWSQDASVLAKSAAKLSARLLTVLTVPAVQRGLGGLQQVQPSIAALESAQTAFKQHAAAAAISRQNNTQHSQWGPACDPEPAGQPMQQQAAPAQQQHPMQASLRCAGHSSPAVAAALSAAVGFVPAPATDRGKDLRLAALLGAAAQYTSGASGGFPPCFTALLATWASLVYGEFAATSSIQVSALFSYHFRTLVRLLELCLQGHASPGGGGGEGQPMPVSTALSHVQGILRLLQYESFKALYTQDEHTRVTDNFLALKQVLQSLPVTACGHATSTEGFYAAVTALLHSSDSGRAPLLPPQPPAAAAAAAAPLLSPAAAETAAAPPLCPAAAAGSSAAAAAAGPSAAAAAAAGPSAAAAAAAAAGPSAAAAAAAAAAVPAVQGGLLGVSSVAGSKHELLTFMSNQLKSGVLESKDLDAMLEVLAFLQPPGSSAVADSNQCSNTQAMHWQR